MYECQMKMIIPPGVGLLVAGLASGICFLLIGSLRKGKGEKRVDDSRCACCLKPFLVGRGVECSDCGGRSCRKACCRWDSVDNAWFCLFCYHTRSWSRKKDKWFKHFGGLPADSEACGNFSTAKSRVYDEGAEDVAVHSELDLAAGGCKARDSMETVREFVEKIVEGLVGNVDDTPIDRLYDHPAYDGLFEAYGENLASALTRLAISLRRCVDNKPATDTPTMAHNALRELVERAVDEARKLPSLGATVSTGLQDDLSLSEQNYEDLLATAILNKVIEKFQNERVDGNSNVLRRKPKSRLAIRDGETEPDEDDDDDEEGSSSLEAASHDDRSSDESGPRTRRLRVRQEPMSLTIEEQIEEVTTTYTSDDEPRSPKATVLDFRNARRVPFPEFGMDIVDPSHDSSEDSQEDGTDLTHVDRITPVETWEENWLFQKRKIQTQSEPVAMLVPNPSADFRALIGDRDAEDTSDLSEFSAQSDDEAEDDESPEIGPKVMPILKVDIDHPPEVQPAERSSVFQAESRGPIAEPSTDRKDRPEVDVHSEPEIGNRINNDGEYPGKINRTSDEPEVEGSVSLKITADPGKVLEVNEVDTDLSPEVEAAGRVHDLSESRGSIAEPSTNREDRPEVGVYSEPEFPSGIEVDRHSQSATTIGRPKVDRRGDANDEVAGSGGRCNGIAEETLKNSSGDVRRNGDANGCHDEEVIANGIFAGDTNRRCEALAQAKADSASVRPSPRSEVNENIGLSTPPRPGTIAEREHKKWENAAPIENNPYSEENIQKRLLERQYARRSSDVSGSTKLQTCPSPPLQIVLGAGRPDFKRFGRDYYINEARNPKGQSVEESGFFTATSRPNSSLSQHSLSIGSDYEQQDRSRSVDTDSTCSTSSEPKASKIASELQPNNVRAALRRSSMPVGRDDGEIEIRGSVSTRQSLIDVSREITWNDQTSIDEILESKRKNSKNEINAKLNNRGNFEESQKPIRRIDLRAYGFENEFNDKNREGPIVQSKRPVNKLDLRSFGYDSGLRRTQSNNNIDRPFKPTVNVRHSEGKSNNGRFSGNPSLTSLESGSDDGISNKCSEASIKNDQVAGREFGRITAAKSVPNIGELYARINDTDRTGDYPEATTKNIHHARSTSIEDDKCNGFGLKNNSDRPAKANGEDGSREKIKLPLPSVRRLAEAFSKTEKENPTAARRQSKSVNVSSKDRPTTPEIHIVDTPKQMHSLTARSLSREFREGLRQISNKQAPLPSRPNVIPEQNRSPDSRAPTNETGSNEDATIMAPGKLKNNIQFWEQLHRKS